MAVLVGLRDALSEGGNLLGLVRVLCSLMPCHIRLHVLVPALHYRVGVLLMLIIHHVPEVLPRALLSLSCMC